MLVYRHPGLFVQVHPAGRKTFFINLEMEKIALILIYSTGLLSSSLHSISCVYLFCNVHATTMNLAYFNPHNPQLTVPSSLVPTTLSAPSVPVDWMMV